MTSLQTPRPPKTDTSAGDIPRFILAIVVICLIAMLVSACPEPSPAPVVVTEPATPSPAPIPPPANRYRPNERPPFPCDVNCAPVKCRPWCGTPPAFPVRESAPTPAAADL